MKVLCDFQWQADRICSRETPDWNALEATNALTSWALTWCKVRASSQRALSIRPGQNVFVFISIRIHFLKYSYSYSNTFVKNAKYLYSYSNTFQKYSYS